MINDAKSFLVVQTREGAWGKADTLADALKNCKRNAGRSGKKEFTVIAFSVPKEEVLVHADVTLSYEWPEGGEAMRFKMMA